MHVCFFTNFRFRGPEVPGWGLWHDVLGRVTQTTHSAPLYFRYFFLLLYCSIRRTLRSYHLFRSFFPLWNLQGLGHRLRSLGNGIVISGMESANPENTFTITKVTLDIQNGKDLDNTNVLMAQKVLKTMQAGENGQSSLM